jgi:hypothetical protein
MKLESIRFERSTYREDSPLTGMVVFKTPDSKIAVALDEEQAKRVMDICAETLQAELTKGIEAMKDSLKVTVAAHKDEKIGLNLPNYF